MAYRIVLVKSERSIPAHLDKAQSLPVTCKGGDGTCGTNALSTIAPAAASLETGNVVSRIHGTFPTISFLTMSSNGDS